MATSNHVELTDDMAALMWAARLTEVRRRNGSVPWRARARRDRGVAETRADTHDEQRSKKDLSPQQRPMTHLTRVVADRGVGFIKGDNSTAYFFHRQEVAEALQYRLVE